MRRDTLAFRIAAVITLLQAILIGAVLWITLSMSRASAEKQLAIKSQVLLAMLGEVSRVALLQGEYDDLQPYVAKLTDDPQVLLVRVADWRDRVVVSTDPTEVGRPLPAGGQPGRLWLVREIANPSGKVGTLSIRLDDALARRDYLGIRNTAILVAVFGVIASAAIGLLVGRVMTRRLKVLAEATQQISEGKFGVSIPVVGNDEVGRLSHLFNRMAESLRMQVASLRKSEERLRQSQKMEAVGQLAGGVAHDFNNLLTVITSCASFLADGVQDPELRADVDEIQKAAKRAAALTRQLLAFGRKGVVDPQVLDLGRLLGETEKLLRRTLGEHIQLSIRVEPGLWRVKADPGQMEQVVMNLAINARDAMPGGGAIALSLRNLAQSAAPEGWAGPISPGEYVLLEVADEGVGMTKEVLRRIFEPFFSTKGEGRGTGLGLATVFGIVKGAGGEIAVDSEPGKGSTFRVYLPRTLQSPALPEEVPAPGQAEHGRGRTVLVVEDEAGVRAQLVRMLRGAGYRAFEAAGGIEALADFERHGSEIDLVITDVVMPHMSAGALAREILQRKPDQRILYVSGYADGVLGAAAVVEKGIRFLQKPFSEADLLAKVRASLADVEPTPQRGGSAAV